MAGGGAEGDERRGRLPARGEGRDPPSAPMGKQAFMLLAPVAMKSTWKEQSAVAAATPAAAAGVEPEGPEVAAGKMPERTNLPTPMPRSWYR